MFSVIVLTYNQEMFIEQTLYSILKQKHNYCYEVVVADDCSSDGTRKLIRRIQNEYPDVIKVIFNDHNLGVIKNYFNALSHCRGKYIMECGGDDYYLPNKVLRQINYLEMHDDVGLICGCAKIFNNTSLRFEKKVLGSPAVKYLDFIKGNRICASTVCYRRELAKQYIDQVNPVKRNWGMEDYPMWIWFSLKSSIYFDDYLYVVYRLVQNSVSHSSYVNKKLSFERNSYEIAWYFSRDAYTRKSILNDYYRRIADILYNYKYFDSAITFIKKCDYSGLDVKTKIKYFFAAVPVLRDITRLVYIKVYNIYCF